MNLGQFGMLLLPTYGDCSPIDRVIFSIGHFSHPVPSLRTINPTTFANMHAQLESGPPNDRLLAEAPNTEHKIKDSHGSTTRHQFTNAMEFGWKVSFLFIRMTLDMDRPFPRNSKPKAKAAILTST